MRVTGTSNYTVMRDALGTSMSRIADLQTQLGTGRRINRASDDPVGAATALRYRSYEADQEAYAQSADDALTRLIASDTALQGMSTSLQRVRALAVSATNGSLSPEARGAIADELVSLRDELATLANSTHAGQALFGGHAGTAVTREGDGSWSFRGDGGSVQRRVGQGTVVEVNLDGRTAFGFDQAAGQDLFSVVDRLATAARTGDTASLQSAQGELAARTTTVLGILSTVGARTNAVESARSRGAQFVDRITAERSNLEDVDLAEAILQLTAAQTGYQAALGAVAKANLPSLANLLR